MTTQLHDWFKKKKTTTTTTTTKNIKKHKKNNKQGLKISYTSLKLIASKEGLQLIVFYTLYRPYL